MTRFLASESLLDGQPVVQLDDTVAGHRVRVARCGAALLNLMVREGEHWFDYADGYRDAAEIAARKGSRFAVMAPFGGRIRDGRYTFDGQAHDLAPGATGAAREVRHGFVRDTLFALDDSVQDAHGARVTLVTDAIRPRPGYPFAIDLTVSFALDARGLALDVAMRNVGARAAPCFFGWHPYFRLSDTPVDPWELRVPAHAVIRTGGDLIALPGAAAHVEIDDAPALDFREASAIGNRILDQGYAYLDADGDGLIRTHLRDPASGRALAVWQERGLLHAFTGDTVSRDPRRAIALEPMECMADAFNRPEWADAVRLAPGAERHFRCGVEIAAA